MECNCVTNLGMRFLVVSSLHYSPCSVWFEVQSVPGYMESTFYVLYRKENKIPL